MHPVTAGAGSPLNVQVRPGPALHIDVIWAARHRPHDQGRTSAPVFVDVDEIAEGDGTVFGAEPGEPSEGVAGRDREQVSLVVAREIEPVPPSRGIHRIATPPLPTFRAVVG